VLALLDERTGSRTEVRPGRDGVLRIAAHIPSGRREPGDVTAWRVLALADLVARVAELRGAQALLAAVFPDSVPGELTDVERAVGSLGVHPPAARASLAEAGASLDGPLDVHVMAGAAASRGAAARDTADAGDRAIDVRCGALNLDADLLPAGENDMLGIRLTFLSVTYGEDVNVDRTALATAVDGLTNSRRLVAQWAESPSSPIPEHTASAVRAAFEELDTSLVIRLLRDLADDAGTAPGAKFEAYAFADRILALDLVREIGRYPS
jgi:hypothetical protein